MTRSVEEKSTAGGRCPVIDFDNTSSHHAQHWPQEFKELRQSCPRGWSESHGGFWLATRYKDIMQIAQASDRFGSAKVIDPETGEPQGGITIPTSAGAGLIPDETDNPEWQGYRKLLNPRFSPRVAEEKRDFAKSIARGLIDRVITNGQFDIVDDLANPLPAIFTMDLLGFPLEDWLEFADPIHKFTYTKHEDPSFKDILAGVEQIRVRIHEGAIARRAQPSDDLLSYIANAEINGALMSMEEVMQMSLQVVFGGVDTTTALTANTLNYLSRNPEQRQRLIDDPSLIPVAREEFVRYFTPVHGLARNALDDTEIDGWHFKKGERVLLAYASGNRDEEIFNDPEELLIDRFPNRHIAFGAGIHRCLGSFFARVMFEAMLSEVLIRMPDYRVVEAESESYPSVAFINGWIRLPASFTPGPKLGGGLSL